MPNPKRRHSKSRRDKRRANWKPAVKGHVLCSQCNSPRLPHAVCMVCGYYNGKPVITIKQKSKEKTAEEK